MGSLFDMHHIAYIIVSLSVTLMALVFGHRHLRSAKGRRRFLKVFALLTVFLHISGLWVSYLKTGQALVADNILFPIFFCNMSMYLLLIVAFIENKMTKRYEHLATFTAYAGIFGGLISLFYPDYYLGASSMFQWNVFKSMTSHSTMVIGSLWLFVAGYAKIKPSNVITYAVGLLFYGLIGIIVNQTFIHFGLRHPNAMYLDHPPLSDVPMLNFMTIPLLMILVIWMTVMINQIATQKMNTNLEGERT